MSYPLVRQTRYQLPPSAPVLLRMDSDEEKEAELSDEAYFRHMREEDEEEEDEEEEENEEDEEDEEEEEDEEDEEDEEEEEDECPICMRHYNNSTRQRYTITSCQLEHPLCRECAIKISKNARQRREQPRCPMCRKEFRGVENKEKKTFSFNENVSIPTIPIYLSKGESFGFYQKSKRTRPSSKILSRRSRNRSPRKTVSRSYKTNKNNKNNK